MDIWRFLSGHTGSNYEWLRIIVERGTGCGSVGRAVDSDTQGPRFESSHWQKFIDI